MKTTIYTTSKRDWGYETLCAVVDDDGRHWDLCITTKEYPHDSTIIITEAEAQVLKSIALKAAEVPEVDIPTLEEQKAVLIAEVEALEVEKAALEKDVSDLERAVK